MGARHLEVVIKPTLQCNAQCEYCNVPRDSARMSLQTLESVFGEIASLLDKDPDFQVHGAADQGPGQAPGPGVSILWHGGEPLLMGERFYEQAIELDRKRLAGRAVHVMQTNLSLATSGMVSVLEELLNDRGMGTSLDPFHDYRHLTAGSYLERWYDGFELVKSRGFRVGMVYVVHGRSVGRARDLYYYFKNLGLDSLTVIPLEEPAGQFLGDRLEPAGWGGFLLELYAAWKNDGRAFVVQPFCGWEDMRDAALPSHSCDLLLSCSEPMVVISPEGDMYPCVRSADIRQGKLGNIMSDSLEKVLQHPDSTWRSSRRDLIMAGCCGSCRWWRFCAGGCAAAAGYRAKTKWCEGYRFFFEASGEW